jgi:glutamate carboxypeptidase
VISPSSSASAIAVAAKTLRTAISTQEPALPGLLAELVSIESHATQPEGVAAVARVVERELAPAGFTWERRRGTVAAEPWLADLMLPGTDYDSVADVLVGRRPGGPGRALLLGDLDTSYEAGAAARFPFRIEGGRAFGPGVADMKGGLVVLVATLRALQELPGPAITVVLSPDEQAGSLVSRAVIEAEAAGADWCFCLECARDGGSLMGSRAHIGVGRLDVWGVEAHAGTAHARGASAIEELAHHVLALQGLSDPAAGVYVTVGQIQGGRRRSVVPGHAWCTIDLRVPNAGAWKLLERRVRDAIAVPRVPRTLTELRIHDHRPGLVPTEQTARLIATVRRAGVVVGISFGVVPSSAAGSSAFVGALRIPTLDGMGPVGADLMTDREHIEVKSLGERALLLALTLHLLATQKGGSS